MVSLLGTYLAIGLIVGTIYAVKVKDYTRVDLSDRVVFWPQYVYRWIKSKAKKVNE